MRKVMFWSPCIYLFIYLYACYSHNSTSIKPNRMKFSGMIGYYPGTIWLYFGIDRVEGHGQGHGKVKIFFLPLTSNCYATNAKMFIIQCQLWYAKVCALPSARSS